MITARQLFEKGYDLVWVVWSEHFIREALGSICLAMAAHSHMKNIGYRIVTYGPINNKAKRLLYMASERGIEHCERVADYPLDAVHMDTWKMRELSMAQRPTFYCDSDLVFFDDLLRTAPLDAFDCTTYIPLRPDKNMQYVEQVVGNKRIDSSDVSGYSYGRTPLRICTGLLFAQHGSAVKPWLGKYEQYTEQILLTYGNWFSEPLLASMIANGDIPIKMCHRHGIQVPMCNIYDYRDLVMVESNGVSIKRVKHIHGHAVGHAWHHCEGPDVSRLLFLLDDNDNVVSPNFKMDQSPPRTGWFML